MSFVRACNSLCPEDISLRCHLPVGHRGKCQAVRFIRWGESIMAQRRRKCQCPIENHNDVPTGECLVCGGKA
jgi:hypothetical protein